MIAAYFSKILIFLPLNCGKSLFETSRYFQGPKSEGGEHSFLSKTLGRNKVLRMESQMDNTLMPPGGVAG
ncbi:hypothetical protein JHK87_002697 [Glycine soja]|nr:hypothetical protein JHK87_002697 [Glycine soja]